VIALSLGLEPGFLRVIILHVFCVSCLPDKLIVSFTQEKFSKIFSQRLFYKGNMT